MPSAGAVSRPADGSAPSARRARADEGDVTRLAMTVEIHNTCNGDIVIVTGTLAARTRMIRGSHGTTFTQRTWMEDVSARSGDTVYEVERTTFDSLRTGVRAGQRTRKSLTASLVRLSPVMGGSGTLTVRAVYAFVWNLETGAIRVLADQRRASCR